MKTVFRCLICFFLLLTLFGCEPRTLTPSEMLAAANELDKRIDAAANSRDLNALMVNYWKSKDYLNLDLHEFVRGYDEWKDILQKWSNRPNLKWESFDVRNVVSGDVVIGSSRWRETLPAENGSPAKISEGLQMNVKAIRDGKWVIIAQAFAVTKPKN